MAVKPHYDLPSGDSYPSVHGPGYAHAWMRQASHRQLRVELLVVGNSVHRPISRASVYDDDLKDRHVLPPESVEQRLDPRNLVPAGNDNRHAFMRSGSFWSNLCR